MAVPDIFDEVSEDLRADQARSLLRRYGWVGGVLLAAVLAGTAVNAWWQDHKREQAEAEAARFIAATPAVAAKDRNGEDLLPMTPESAAKLRDIAATGSPGYRSLARILLAKADRDAGRLDAAIAALQSVAADTEVPQGLRDLATLSAAQIEVDHGDPAKIRAELTPLLGNPAWRAAGEQVLALLALRQGNTDEAIKILRSISQEAGAPAGVQHLSSDMLQMLGAAVEPQAGAIEEKGK